MQPSIFDKIREARAAIEKQGAKVEIQLDGGIRRNTVPQINEAGGGLDRAGVADVWRRSGGDAGLAGKPLRFRSRQNDRVLHGWVVWPEEVRR